MDRIIVPTETREVEVVTPNDLDLYKQAIIGLESRVAKLETTTPLPPPPPPPVTLPTNGDWYKAAGADGYFIAALHPINTTGTLHVWASKTSEERALANGATRFASCWYNAKSFEVTFNYTGKVTLYFLDWDRQGREIKVDINGQSFDIKEYTEGKYLQVDVSGDTKIVVTNLLDKVNATLSGIFFGGPTTNPEPPPPAQTVMPNGTKLKLLGGWAVPANSGTNPSLNFMVRALAVKRESDKLKFATGWGALVEFTADTPMSTSKDIEDWPWLTQVAVDNVSYKPVQDDPLDTTVTDPSPQGVEYWDDKVIRSGFNTYAAPVPNDPFLIVRTKLYEADGKQVADTEGPYGFGGGCQMFGGGIVRLPKHIADEYFDGFDLLLPSGGYHSGQGSTAGAAAMIAKFDKLAYKTDPAFYRELIRFGNFGGTSKHDRERRDPNYSTPVWSPPPDGDIGYWAADEVLSDGCFIDHPKFKGLIFSCAIGQGPMNYSWQTLTFADSIKLYMYAYTLEDMVKVFRGEMKPYEIRAQYIEWINPFDFRKFDKMFAPVGLKFFEGKLYVIFKWARQRHIESTPVLGVFELE